MAESGFSGWSGFSGHSGFSGFSGFSGEKGDAGTEFIVNNSVIEKMDLFGWYIDHNNKNINDYLYANINRKDLIAVPEKILTNVNFSISETADCIVTYRPIEMAKLARCKCSFIVRQQDVSPGFCFKIGGAGAGIGANTLMKKTFANETTTTFFTGQEMFFIIDDLPVGSTYFEFEFITSGAFGFVAWQHYPTPTYYTILDNFILEAEEINIANS